MRRAVVAGANGFLGSKLTESLAKDGYDVVRLVRRASGTMGEEVWDGKTDGEWIGVLEGAEVVFNLAGSPVNQRWNDIGKRAIKESRINATTALGRAIARSSDPPKVWVNASAVGYYGDTGDVLVDETSGPGSGFLAEVCCEWEGAAKDFELSRTRVVLPRIGFVLSRDGGGLPVLIRLAKWFLGGSAGRGTQHIPWIHVDDCIRALRMLASSEIHGAVNVVGPRSSPNSEVMARVRSLVHRPWSPPAPAAAIRLAGAIFGFPSELALGGQRVDPTVLRMAGFQWERESLTAALTDKLVP